MSARGFLRDASGIARQGKRLFLDDLSGIPRQAKRIFERDASGIPRLVYQLGLTFTMDAGALSFAGYPGAGYASGSAGSMSPVTMPDGTIVTGLFTSTNASGLVNLSLEINGFSSQPPQTYLQSLVLTGGSPSGTYTGASATFGYGSGLASWVWQVTSQFTVGDAYSGVITSS